MRSDTSFAMQNAILTLRGRAARAHDFNPDRTIAATFQTLPGASFVVNGAAQARDAALATVSAEMKWLNGFSLAATFEGEFSNVTGPTPARASRATHGDMKPWKHRNRRPIRWPFRGVNEARTFRGMDQLPAREDRDRI